MIQRQPEVLDLVCVRTGRRTRIMVLGNGKERSPVLEFTGP